MKLKMCALLAIMAVTLVGVAMLFTGCDPEKIGGGNQLQPYSRATGQYK